MTEIQPKTRIIFSAIIVLLLGGYATYKISAYPNLVWKFVLIYFGIYTFALTKFLLKIRVANRYEIDTKTYEILKEKKRSKKVSVKEKDQSDEHIVLDMHNN